MLVTSSKRYSVASIHTLASIIDSSILRVALALRAALAVLRIGAVDLAVDGLGLCVQPLPSSPRHYAVVIYGQCVYAYRLALQRSKVRVSRIIIIACVWNHVTVAFYRVAF